MPTDPNYEARSQKIRVFVLQNNTAFDAAELDGTVQIVSDFNAVWLWFTPTGSYDGTVIFEISPDGGVTWFAVQGYKPDARTTLITQITSPALTDSVIIPMADFSHLRARMTGGSQGTLTVSARLVDIPTSVG